MGLSAIECLHRGVMSARANWELVLVHWLQLVLITVATLAGLLPPLVVLGLDEAFEGLVQGDTDAAAAVLDRLVPTVDMVAPLVAAVGVTVLVWSLAFVVYCFMQAAIFGILWTADRQAPQGSTRNWQWFRTFNLRDLAGWGRRLGWRYFWLVNVIMGLSMLWLLLPFIVLLLSIWGYQRWGGTAAFGLGCGGSIPVIFGFVVLAMWGQLAMAAGARRSSDVWTAVREGVQVLGARLGGMVMLFVLVIAAGLTLALVFAPVSVVLELALGAGSGTSLILVGGLSIVQWIASSLINIVFAGALVAMVRTQARVRETEG